MIKARYIYSCSLCKTAEVTKTPTGSKISKDKTAGLHGWRCNRCGPGVRVNRQMA